MVIGCIMNTLELTLELNIVYAGIGGPLDLTGQTSQSIPDRF